MVLWYAGVSVVLVAYVFRSTGVDYRFVAGGALLPLLVDLPLGRSAYAHTLVAGAGLLAVAMVATIGRPRLLRRRLVCIPIGFLCGLVLSGIWAEPDVFWWPVSGRSFPDEPLLPPLVVVALEELAGLAACAWVVIRFGLADPARRAEFLRSGRLREVARS